MAVGALAQIDRGEMEAEHFRGADQRLETLRGDHLAVMAAQQIVDDHEIGEKGARIGVGIAGRDRMALRLAGRSAPRASPARRE